jgi:hypothetical protein
MWAEDIPVVQTPRGGYDDEMPAPILVWDYGPMFMARLERVR